MQITTQLLKDAFNGPLPGKEAQLLMSPSVRFTGVKLPDRSLARESSVLILLYPKNGVWYIPLMLRQVYKGAHSGQISFPGGKKEKADKHHWATALRETYEELGVKHEDVEFIGELTSLYIPNSNYIVYPQVGIIKYAPHFVPDQREVATIIEAPINDLCNPTNIKRFSRQINNAKVDAPYFSFQSYEIWGATAMMMSEFIQVLNSNGVSSLLHSYNDYNAQGYQ